MHACTVYTIPGGLSDDYPWLSDSIAKDRNHRIYDPTSFHIDFQFEERKKGRKTHWDDDDDDDDGDDDDDDDQEAGIVFDLLFIGGDEFSHEQEDNRQRRFSVSWIDQLVPCIHLQDDLLRI